MSAQQRLGEVLVELGFIDQATLDRALEEQSRSGLRLGKVLGTMGAVSEERLVRALSRQLNLETCDPVNTPVHQRVRAILTPELAHAWRVVPIALKKEEGVQVLFLATADPLDRGTFDALMGHVGANYRVQWLLAGEGEIETALARHYGPPPAAISTEDEPFEVNIEASVDVQAADAGPSGLSLDLPVEAPVELPPVLASADLYVQVDSETNLEMVPLAGSAPGVMRERSHLVEVIPDLPRPIIEPKEIPTHMAIDVLSNRQELESMLEVMTDVPPLDLPVGPEVPDKTPLLQLEPSGDLLRELPAETASVTVHDESAQMPIEIDETATASDPEPAWAASVDAASPLEEFDAQAVQADASLEAPASQEEAHASAEVQSSQDDGGDASADALEVEAPHEAAAETSAPNLIEAQSALEQGAAEPPPDEAFTHDCETLIASPARAELAAVGLEVPLRDDVIEVQPTARGPAVIEGLSLDLPRGNDLRAQTELGVPERETERAPAVTNVSASWGDLFGGAGSIDIRPPSDRAAVEVPAAVASETHTTEDTVGESSSSSVPRSVPSPTDPRVLRRALVRFIEGESIDATTTNLLLRVVGALLLEQGLFSEESVNRVLPLVLVDERNSTSELEAQPEA